MAVNPPLHFDFGRTVPAFLLPLFVGIGTGAVLAQGQNPTSAANPFYGSVTVQQVTNEPLKLSLDDAIQRGLKNNLGLREAENGEKTLHGMRNEALQEFLPTIWLTGDTGYYMHNLAAQGFGPKTIGEFSSLFPGGKIPAGLSLITRDDLTQGQIHFSQILFSGPVIESWKVAGAAGRGGQRDRLHRQPRRHAHRHDQPHDGHHDHDLNQREAAQAPAI